MSSELAAIDWLGRGWLLLLAFTVAVLVVAALRKPCRRLFGTERAFQLWLLPPLAMLASQLPHAAVTPVTAWSTMVSTVTSAAILSPMPVAPSHAIDWRAWIVVFWLAGITASLLLAVRGQVRYRRRLRGAIPVESVPVGSAALHYPVLRATAVDVGPALVGAWRSRIVLPADFEQRYSGVEQTLILAHETMHARRRDGWWCLLGRIFAAGFWFHPLAWWAFSALRHDQELACDAAVLREHGAQRRSYANAMLKTQSAAIALPVGCPWSPRHPITERIAMLKMPSPNRLRRHIGTTTGCALAMVVAGSVYAVSAPPPSPSVGQARNAEYQLNMMVEGSTDDGHKRHSETAAFALCMEPGIPAASRVGGLNVEATTTPAGNGQVSIALAVNHDGISPPVHSQLRGALGETLHGTSTGADDKHTYVVDVTAQAGCPARVLAEASPVKVTEHVKNGTARSVAESIAAKAGWTLRNPQVLGDAAVTVSFNQMSAGTALQQVADLAGKTLVLDGKQARFEPK